jgi:hypothetical protein
VARNSRHYDMACRYVPDNGQYMFHQPCGYWNKPCKHSCGYMHLSSSSTGTRNKCCAKGHLSYNSPNCELDLLIKHDLREKPSFMIQVVTTPEFLLNSSTYNNLLAMGGTKVCNYNETPGWTQRGPGSACVTLNGRIHHNMKNANSTDPSCGLAWFIFDDISSLAATASACNVNPAVLQQKHDGLKNVNSYCVDLQFLDLEA